MLFNLPIINDEECCLMCEQPVEQFCNDCNIAYYYGIKNNIISRSQIIYSNDGFVLNLNILKDSGKFINYKSLTYDFTPKIFHFKIKELPTKQYLISKMKNYTNVVELL